MVGMDWLDGGLNEWLACMSLIGCLDVWLVNGWHGLVELIDWWFG